jgi:hypothetical protein
LPNAGAMVPAWRLGFYRLKIAEDRQA